MLSKQLRLDVAQLTDVGLKRPHNEDNMAHVIPKDALLMTRKGALFIVADGMGGHAAGEVASEIAVEAVTNAYYQDDSEDIAISLLHAIKRANALIHQKAAENMLRSGMGTTCVAAVLRGNMAYVANVGDSRAYLTRGGQMKQVSQDHSWVEEQVRAGLLTRDQARSHAQRNVITRCLGTQSDVEVDVFSEELEEGDTLILCSDGLSGLVGDDELCTIVDQYVPQESVYHLIERARENGGPDNITAIVMRVQEVGWEPPYVRYPAYVGSNPESSEGEDTAILGRISGPMAMPASMENNRTPSAPLHLTSSPFLSSDNLAPQRSALVPPRRKPRRLLYPIILVLVLLIALIGGAAYYFLRPTVDVDTLLMDASTMVSRANSEVASNPTDALAILLKVQTELRGTLDSSSLTDTQRTSIQHLLDSDFTKAVRTAITDYNQQSAITVLPCSNTSSAPINNGQTGAQASSIVTLQDGKGNTFLYALSDHHGFYQIDDHNLVDRSKDLPSDAQPIIIAGDNSNQSMVVLTTSPGKDADTLSYTLRLLKLDGGILKDINNSPIDASFIKDSHNKPMLMAVWGTDVYVMITSDVASNQATILDFSTSGDKFQSGLPHSTTISVSSSILSIAAFPKNQLLLLDSSGSVQSLQLNGSNQLPVSLGVTHFIATPLAISDKDFTSSKPVPIPGQSSSHFLAIPGATSLTTATVGSVPHLYIADEADHRVLDLMLAPDSPSNTATVVPSPTPTLATSGTGGGVANPSSSINMELLQQYVSANLLTSVKGIAVDPNALLYLLAQSGQNSISVNLVSINANQSSACASSRIDVHVTIGIGRDFA